MKISCQPEFCGKCRLDKNLALVVWRYGRNGSAEFRKSLIAKPGCENEIEIFVVCADGGLQEIVSLFTGSDYVVIQSKKRILIKTGPLAETHAHKDFISHISASIVITQPDLTIAVFPVVLSCCAGTC